MLNSQWLCHAESTETTEDTSDSADELYTSVTVEDVEFQSPRKKKN